MTGNQDDFLASERDRAELQDASDAFEATVERAAGAGAELDRLVAERRRRSLVDVVTEVMALPEMVGEPNDGGRSLVSRSAVLDILGRYASAMSADQVRADAAERRR